MEGLRVATPTSIGEIFSLKAAVIPPSAIRRFTRDSRGHPAHHQGNNFKMADLFGHISARY
jgi:hypothetical protein